MRHLVFWDFFVVSVQVCLGLCLYLFVYFRLCLVVFVVLLWSGQSLHIDPGKAVLVLSEGLQVHTDFTQMFQKRNSLPITVMSNDPHRPSPFLAATAGKKPVITSSRIYY